MAHLYERRRFPYPGDEEAVTEFILKGGMLGTAIGPKGIQDSDKDSENFQKELQSEKFHLEAKKLWSRMKNEVIQELQEKGFEGIAYSSLPVSRARKLVDAVTEILQTRDTNPQWEESLAEVFPADEDIAPVVARFRNPDSALAFFSWLRQRHFTVMPDYASYSTLLCLLAKARRLEESQLVLETMLTEGKIPTCEAFSTLVGSYARYDLQDASWSVLKRSLRQKRAPNPGTYLAKIYAYSSLENLQRAFSTLNELETAYGNSENVDNELFSPFTSLFPLVSACCKNGFSTLDSVYVQLENLSNADPPYKSVAALNCVVLGCVNIWDLDRAYETFEAITEKIGTTPDIHSYNALLCVFGKVKKTSEACKVFEHSVSLGVKPNATTYALLVDARLFNRDPKAALHVIDEMVESGFTPSKEMLKKVQRWCSRELDADSDERLQSLVHQFSYMMGGEGRRELLYSINYGSNY